MTMKNKAEGDLIYEEKFELNTVSAFDYLFVKKSHFWIFHSFFFII